MSVWCPDGKTRECGCWFCLRDGGAKVWWMVVCAKCGNKRCPHATFHGHECTGSNSPGQLGSVFGSIVGPPTVDIAPLN